MPEFQICEPNIAGWLVSFGLGGVSNQSATRSGKREKLAIPEQKLVMNLMIRRSFATPCHRWPYGRAGSLFVRYGKRSRAVELRKFMLLKRASRISQSGLRMAADYGSSHTRRLTEIGGWHKVSAAKSCSTMRRTPWLPKPCSNREAHL